MPPRRTATVSPPMSFDETGQRLVGRALTELGALEWGTSDLAMDAEADLPTPFPLQRRPFAQVKRLVPVVTNDDHQRPVLGGNVPLVLRQGPNGEVADGQQDLQGSSLRPPPRD